MQEQKNVTIPDLFAGSLLAVPLVLFGGLLVTLLGYSLNLLPSISLDIAAGLVAVHLALVGWAKFKRLPATWVPFCGSLGVFFLFVLTWGAIMKVNEVGNYGSDQIGDMLYESAKAMLGYSFPVLLPLMGIARTLVELDPNS